MLELSIQHLLRNVRMGNDQLSFTGVLVNVQLGRVMIYSFFSTDAGYSSWHTKL
jgi:hypothetical protein